MNETEQLLQDLTAVEEEILQRGWRRGRLIKWLLPADWRGLGSSKSHCGAMCMTGAVGVAVEGADFVRYAADSGTHSAKDWSWSDRGLRTLEALLRQHYYGSSSMFFIGLSRACDSARARLLVERIIWVNDSVLTDKQAALAWIRATTARVSLQLLEEKEAEKEAQRKSPLEQVQAVERPPKRVVRSTPGVQAVEKQPETA